MNARNSHSPVLVHKLTAIALAALLAFAPALYAERTKLKPGWNLFSPQQDVEIGQSAAKDAEKQLPMLNDARVDSYIDKLGKSLASKAPGEKYPYQFKVVNDRSINAFALPGGFIFVHRGIIENADNEAQLAGVIGHEIGHVALRHGTNQATKASAAQLGIGILGAVTGGGVASQVAQLGTMAAAQTLLLKYGRDAERQSDTLGTQILYDLNYDPRAMAQFFEKLEASGGSRGPEFLSSHPNPGNRMRGVLTEIDKIGAFPKNAKTDSAEFRSIKAYVSRLPEPPKKAAGATGSGGGGTTGSGPGGAPPTPSSSLKPFQNRQLQLQHPENWQPNAQGDAVTFIPQGGVVQDAQGNGSLAYGVIVNLFEPSTGSGGQITHAAANDQLIEELRRGNPKMRLYRRAEQIRAGASRVNAMSTVLVNESPMGGRELDWLVTFVRPEGLLYFVFVVPEKDAGQYEPHFQSMLNSLKFADYR